MGQIFGMGWGAGDKTKSETTVKTTPELRHLYGDVTGMTQGMLPRYRDLLERALRGETDVSAPYARPVAPTYQNVAGQAYTPMAGSYNPTMSGYIPLANTYGRMTDAYTPMEGTYQPYSTSTYVPMAGSYRPTEGAYTPVSGNFASVAGAFQPGKEAYTAPYAGQIQSAQQQIRRAMPGGGGQQAALAQATMQGAMEMGAARAAQAQRDIDARNTLAQEDVRTRMGLGLEDTRNLGERRLEDVRGLNTLTQRTWPSGSACWSGTRATSTHFGNRISHNSAVCGSRM